MVFGRSKKHQKLQRIITIGDQLPQIPYKDNNYIRLEFGMPVLCD
jgi:hypothetical protein